MTSGDVYQMRLRVCDNGYYLEWGLRPQREGDVWPVHGALVARSATELARRFISALVALKLKGVDDAKT